MSATWSPSSWRTKPIKQDVAYESKVDLDRAAAKLQKLPPLVSPQEILKLKKSLTDVALGKAFLLQGGDCAELFDYCEDKSITSKIKLLLQMSLVLVWGANIPVVRIARMAGQYAKPRSSPTEAVNGEEIPSFRGDILNGFDASERKLDPGRLVSAYFHSAATLNYIRAQLSSGIADLHSPWDWDLGHIRNPHIKAQYQSIVNSISESLRFMKTVGADTAAQLGSVDLFTSHEGLVLDYEECLTRKGPGEDEPWFDTSAHFLWIGDRTRQLEGAHVEFFKGLANPIGIKVGPSMKDDELVELLDVVNPRKEIGKITLITRYGYGKIKQHLAGHIRAVQKSGHVVVWQCDPMHGNTHSSSSGLKTRSFSSIYSELSSALEIHRANNSFLGGVHLELTGDAVTECLGGSENLTDEDLPLNYTSYCDPRLNEKQALELAFLIAGSMRGET